MRTMDMEVMIVTGKYIIFMDIPLNFPIILRAASYSIPDATNLLGTIKVERAESDVDKKPFKQRGNDITSMSNKSCNLSSVFDRLNPNFFFFTLSSLSDVRCYN